MRIWPGRTHTIQYIIRTWSRNNNVILNYWADVHSVLAR